MAISTTFIPKGGDGVPYKNPVEVIATSTAITAVAGGIVLITKADVAVLTLAAPYKDGARLTIVSATAAAHTITNTAGFGGGTTSRDVATFGGAINDSIDLVSYNGVWWVVSTRNVTLG
jgi:hypothetical protein